MNDKIEVSRELLEDMLNPCADFATHGRLRALLDAPVVERQPDAYQFQDHQGAWLPFVNEHHYKSTLADGTWPIRALYAALPHSSATTCQGHGRPECATCCWPKGEPLSGVELCRQLVEQVLSVMPENYAGHSFGVTAPDGSPLGDVIITVVKPDGKGPHELRLEAEAKVAGYTAVDMSTAAADGYRDGKANAVAKPAFIVMSCQPEGKYEITLTYFGREVAWAAHDAIMGASSETPA